MCLSVDYTHQNLPAHANFYAIRVDGVDIICVHACIPYWMGNCPISLDIGLVWLEDVYTQLQYSIMPHMPRHVGAVPCYHGILDSSPISKYYGILRIRMCVQVIRVYSEYKYSYCRIHCYVKKPLFRSCTHTALHSKCNKLHVKSLNLPNNYFLNSPLFMWLLLYNALMSLCTVGFTNVYMSNGYMYSRGSSLKKFEIK